MRKMIFRTNFVQVTNEKEMETRLISKNDPQCWIKLKKVIYYELIGKDGIDAIDEAVSEEYKII